MSPPLPPPSYPSSHNIDKLQIMAFYVVSPLQREMSRCDICKNKESRIRGVLSARKYDSDSDHTFLIKTALFEGSMVGRADNGDGDYYKLLCNTVIVSLNNIY